MVSITAGTIELHNLGDLRMVTMDLTSVANSETLDIVHMRNIVSGSMECTTNATTQVTFSGKTVTFVNGSTLAGKLTVYGK